MENGIPSIRLSSVIFKATYLCFPRLKKEKNQTLVVNSNMLKIFVPRPPENVSRERKHQGMSLGLSLRERPHADNLKKEKLNTKNY